MKLIICLCVMFMSTMAKELFSLAPESQKRMRTLAQPCAEEFNVDPSFIPKIGEPEAFPRTEPYNNFLFCFGIKSGIINADGHINPEKLLGILGDHPLSGEVGEAIKKCNEITKEDVLATAIAMHTCYGEQFPIRFGF